MSINEVTLSARALCYFIIYWVLIIFLALYYIKKNVGLQVAIRNKMAIISECHNWSYISTAISFVSLFLII